jgi:hypothetical protein
MCVLCVYVHKYMTMCIVYLYDEGVLGVAAVELLIPVLLRALGGRGADRVEQAILDTPEHGSTRASVGEAKHHSHFSLIVAVLTKVLCVCALFRTLSRRLKMHMIAVTAAHSSTTPRNDGCGGLYLP